MWFSHSTTIKNELILFNGRSLLGTVDDVQEKRCFVTVLLSSVHESLDSVILKLAASVNSDANPFDMPAHSCEHQYP